MTPGPYKNAPLHNQSFFCLELGIVWGFILSAQNPQTREDMSINRGGDEN